MKFILFNIKDINKSLINKIDIDRTNYINEIVFSKDVIEFVEKEPKNIIAKIIKSYKEQTIRKIILKALEGRDGKWYYLTSNNAVNSKYLVNKAQELLGYKVSITNELNTNIFKYIDEYVETHKISNYHDMKVLLVAKISNSIEFKLVENLIKRYKTVNIYLSEKPTEYILRKIKEINISEGTAIEVLKAERKSFNEYNVIYFADSLKEQYPRFRLNKNALVIDQTLKDIDKFNSNLIFINDYLERNGVNKCNIEKKLEEYNLIGIASVIKELVTKLDKS